MFPALYAKRQLDLGITWDLLLGYGLPAIVIVGAFVWARREFRTHPVSRAAAYAVAVASSYFVAASVFYYTPVAAAQTGSEWRDPSPHSATLVTVEDGIQLEVLDWGGSGRPLVLLAGLGDSAHVFDDFAPMLTEQHRVYAVSRRGFGGSSDPSQPVDFDRLADDVVSVLDSLDLEQPVVVGHSFAGDEMHVLGSRHASRIAALIYMDAAFDRTRDFADYDAKLGELPRFSGPQPGDLAATSTLREFWARNRMPAYPEAEVRQRFVVAPDGAISGRAQPPPAVQQAYSAAMNATQAGYDPGPVRVPALAIYAVPDRVEDLMRPWFPTGDAAVLQTLEDLFVVSRERFRQQEEWFRALAGDSARTMGLPGDHYLFVTHAPQVREAVEAFVSSLD
jgi:pimeloyl-ACP methyl ester carboxylesterase